MVLGTKKTVANDISNDLEIIVEMSDINIYRLFLPNFR